LSGLGVSIAHQLPGRTRFRVAKARGHAFFFQQLRDELSTCPLIHRVEVSAVTGSVLVWHDGSAADVLKFANDRRLLDVSAEEAPDVPPVEAIANSVSRLDERVRAASAGRWSVGAVGFYGLVSATVYQLARGRVLPPAGTLAFQALSVFLRALDADRAQAKGRG